MTNSCKHHDFSGKKFFTKLVTKCQIHYLDRCHATLPGTLGCVHLSKGSLADFILYILSVQKFSVLGSKSAFSLIFFFIFPSVFGWFSDWFGFPELSFDPPPSTTKGSRHVVTGSSEEWCICVTVTWWWLMNQEWNDQENEECDRMKVSERERVLSNGATTFTQCHSTRVFHSFVERERFKRWKRTFQKMRENVPWEGSKRWAQRDKQTRARAFFLSSHQFLN